MTKNPYMIYDDDNDNDYYDVLEELKSLRHWVCYIFIDKENGKQSKMPINPNDNDNNNDKKQGASASNHSTWGSYDEAKTAVRTYGLAGVGFEFGEQFQGYVGIDLDNVVLQDGTLKPFAQDIVNTLNSYTEYSPSGKGLHIICKADIGMENWGYGSNVSHRNDNIGFEMYDSKRFFTITEKIYGKAKSVENRTAQLKSVYEKYLHKNKSSSVNTAQNITPTSTPINTTPSMPPSPNPVANNVNVFTEDQDLWYRMFQSQKGQKIIALFNGDTSGYDNDDSRADLALCSYLAYWTGDDTVRMDRMFRQSRLMRPKWTQGNNPTYGERTIQTAIRKNHEDNSNYFLNEEMWRIMNQHMPQSSQAQSSMPEVSQKANTISNVLPTNDTVDNDVSVVEYFDKFFDNDVKEFNSRSRIRSGFNNLDAETSLYPGLYTLGAIPGLGKTTFATQLADNLARDGQHVLFFSLEQQQIELVSKGLSRLLKQWNQELTSIEIRKQGRSNPLVVNAINAYRNFAANEHFISCHFTNFDFIKNKVEKYIREKQVTPVVIVDYLQIIQPSDNNKSTTKDVIDTHVREFKKLQKSYNLILILISSLNRANYAAPIDYESFKETGAIEYTADVIWGLQLQIMSDWSISSNKESVSEKREKIKQAKLQVPRKLKLVCIKNRLGKNYSCLFDYYAPYDLFIGVQDNNVNNNINTINTVPQTMARI